MAVLDTDFGYNFILCSPYFLGWKCQVCPDHEILSDRDANENVLQVPSTVILHIQFENAV